MAESSSRSVLHDIPRSQRSFVDSLTVSPVTVGSLSGYRLDIFLEDGGSMENYSVSLSFSPEPEYIRAVVEDVLKRLGKIPHLCKECGLGWSYPARPHCPGSVY